MIKSDNIIVDYSIPNIDISREDLYDLLHMHKQKIV